MVKLCSIISCKSQYTPGCGIAYHSFPRKDIERKKWLDSIPADLINEVTASTFVCSLHFRAEDYHNTPTGRNCLKRDAVPICFKPLPIMEQLAEGNLDHVESIDSENKGNMPSEPILTKADAATQVSPKRLKPSPREEALISKVDMLQKRLKRRDTKIQSLEGAIKSLKETSSYSEGIEAILKRHFSDTKLQLLLNEIHNNNVTPNHRQYPEEIRQLALTIYFYSPKAYEVLRQYLYLPHSATIRKWMSSYDCEPGLLTEVFNYLEAETKKSPSLRNVALVFDAMSIRAETAYDVAKDKYSGFVNYGDLIEGESDKFASQALVFQIVSFTEKFKCPVAYVFSTGASAQEQAELLTKIIIKLYDVGVIVRSITCDGTKANFSTYKYLGCDFSSNNLDELKTSFRHPCQQTEIHCILDPCHMAKLCRNTAGDKDDIESISGMISFKFIRALHVLQEKEDLTLANKLSPAHLLYKRKKMKVNLAVQTLSSGVADAIDYLRACDVPGFEKSEPTTEFIRYFDRLFDMMNSRNVWGKGFKSPMRPGNLQYFQDVYAETRSYVSNLKIEGVPAIQHPRNTFALGYVINTHSFINLARDLFNLAENPLKYFLAYKCSQDHIELTFCCIRSRGGWNNNPSCLQFKWALRQLLFRNRVEPSINANCVGDATDITPILDFRSKKRSLTTATSVSDSDNEELQDRLLSALDSIELSSLQKNILHYITGFIIRGIIDRITCDDCKTILINKRNQTDHCYSNDINSHSSFTTFVSRGELVFPSDTAFNIITNAEKAFQAELRVGSMGKANFKKILITTVVQKLMATNNVFSDQQHPLTSISQDEELHELQLMKLLVSSYANMRIKSYAKKMTQRHLGQRINDRQHLHNTILFYNI